MKLVLGYFDNIRGPLVFESHPEPITNSQRDFIQKLMDIEGVNQFFKYETNINEKIVFINYLFEIPSQIGRGKVELLMLSILIDHPIELVAVEYLFKETAKKFQKDPKIYLAFYHKKQLTEDTKTEYMKLKEYIREFYEILQTKLEQISMIDRFFTQRPIDTNTPNAQIAIAIINTFITSIDARLPQGAAQLYDIGTIVADKLQRLFPATILTDLLDQIREFWTKQSFGRIGKLVMIGDQGSFRIFNSFECIQYPDLGQTMCKFHEGFFTGLFRLRVNKNIIVKELECLATGNSSCLFVIWIQPELGNPSMINL